MITKLEYIENYLDSEIVFRDLYGENTYFSKPAVHESDGDFIPIAPWAYYLGDPLVLPTIDFVDYIGISEATTDNQIQTDVYYLKHVVSVLDQAYGVQTVDLPVPHAIVKIPVNGEDYIRGLVEQLPKVGGQESIDAPASTRSTAMQTAIPAPPERLASSEMNKPRKLPHKAHTPNMQAFMLNSMGEDYEKTNKKLLSGELDSRLHYMFRGAADRASRLAALRYFYDSCSVEDLMELWNDSACAAANAFRLVNPHATQVTFEWQGNQGSVPALQRIDVPDFRDVTSGLEYAVLTDRQHDLQVLVDVEPAQMVNPDFSVPSFMLGYTVYLQCLSVGNDVGAKSLRERMSVELSAGVAAQVPFVRSKYEVFLAIPDGDANELTRLINANLALHKKAYDTETDNMRREPRGLYSISMLTALALLKQRGISLDIVSEYIPEEILQAVFAATNPAPRPGFTQTLRRIFGINRPS